MYMVCFMFSVCIMALTMLWGATLGGFGTVGFFLQLALVIYLIFMSLRNKITDIKAQIFPEKETSERKSYTLFLTLGVVVVTYMNHFLFKIGYANLSPKLIELLTGWGLLLWGLITIGFINMIFKQVVLTYYFAKYAERFRVDLGFSNIQWYGEKKAQKIKQRELKNKNK
ncbi:hypothetical protein FD11_GL001621 [Ligilactobacillus pobuzihii E100301 = KCTC 13174]|uniref:Uncharacterized protein n=2 Tax=Ligilactobacillus pobuzihii TaxID=449659 RepID=A0A0R2LCK3_9LACO|nr:hypothetical protein FD11_GL001621 [Ligilactobacillus pobuzihii E100301 = KCTC 13174]KRN99592.1 hypothetical protein IV66_GL001598 [Ligilactobacillus pobuzihii]